MYLGQILYQHVPCMPSHVCQTLRQLDYVLKFFARVQKEEKQEKKNQRNLASFYKLVSQEWLGWFSSNLVSSLPSYASISTTNWAYFRLKVMELWTGWTRTLFFMLVFSNCLRMPRILGPRNTLSCVLIRSARWTILIEHTVGVKMLW